MLTYTIIIVLLHEILWAFLMDRKYDDVRFLINRFDNIERIDFAGN